MQNLTAQASNVAGYACNLVGRLITRTEKPIPNCVTESVKSLTCETLVEVCR